MWENLFRSVVWLRGVIGAFALLGFLPQFVPFSQFEILRAVHAVILGWNEIAKYIGKLIASIFSVPDLHAGKVNILIIILSFNIPGGLVPRPRIKYLKYFILALYSFIIVELFRVEYDEEMGRYILGLVSISGTIGFYWLCRSSRAYRIGFVTVVTALLTLEALYLVNLPGFRDGVNGFADRVLEQPAEG